MADGDRWVVSPVGAGRIIELDGETVCMATDQRHARYLVSVANAWERSAGAPTTSDRVSAAIDQLEGDRLDAERRGERVCTCGADPSTPRHAHHLACGLNTNVIN